MRVEAIPVNPEKINKLGGWRLLAAEFLIFAGMIFSACSDGDKQGSGENNKNGTRNINPGVGWTCDQLENWESYNLDESYYKDEADAGNCFTPKKDD